jgi:hypothetical protein
MSASDETLLVLTGLGIPDYSARALVQTLQPVEATVAVQRTINGELMDWSFDQFRKYKSTISCTDQQAPAIDGIWPGQEVTVDCVSELCYPVGGSPGRPVVDGSERTVGGFVFYRPQLTMLVTGYSASQDEYGATVQWQLELEER